MRNILIGLFLLVTCSTAWAIYYIDPTVAVSGDGSIATPWKDCTELNALADSSTNVDVYIYAGTTLRCQLNPLYTGTSTNLSEITSYNKGYQNLARPLIDGSVAVTGWTSYDPSIYSASVVSTTVYPVSVDDVLLQQITWNTNIATTKASMYAGTYTFDDAGDLLYVWTTDSANPTSKIVQYASIANGIHTYQTAADTWKPNSSYMWFHGLQFRMHKGSNIAMTQSTYNESSQGTIIEDNDFSKCGYTCLITGGIGAIIRNNTCKDANGRGTIADNKPCITIDGGGTASDFTAYGMKVYGNTVTENRWGSCYEANWDVESMDFHHNTGLNCAIMFLEGWETSNSKIYNNYGNVSGYAYRNNSGKGISLTNNSDDNKVYNNKLIGFKDAGLSVGAYYLGTYYCGEERNKFYNNTVLGTDSTQYEGIHTHSECSGQELFNEFKNNIVITGANGYVVDVNDTTTILGNNIYYTDGSKYAKWLGVEKANLAALVAVSGETGSISSDPLVDMTLYAPQSGSPALCSGNAQLGVSQDYNGKVRSSCNDIGAIQTTNDTSHTTF